ncbi:MAG: glycosyltransferase [Planctomycetota bacterium]
MARILHISTRLILGGSQENTVLSCEGQAAIGHELHLAFGPIYGPEGSMLDRVGAFRVDPSDDRSPGITTHEVPDLIREVHPLRDMRARAQLRELIRRVQPDIVHTHSSKAGILGRLAAHDVWRERRDGTPAVVHTIHGPPFMPVEGGAASRLKIRLMNQAYTVAERHAARASHAIASVADAMTEQFLERSVGTPELYTTVRSGMEVGPYLDPKPGEHRDEVRAALGLAHDDFVVGTVARLAQHKGHDDLLDALATGTGSPMTRDPSLKLLWVGDGWWRGRLTERVREAGLTDRVIMTGLVPPERVPAMIRAMDVLAHPSYREGLPRTVPQALLTGVLPVAYDCDGTSEACREMETGRLVPVGDRDGLREAIVWARDNPEERARLEATGRAWCLEHFSAEAMVHGLESVYERARERARPR